MPLKAGSIFQFTCLENFETLKIMNLASNFRRRDAKKVKFTKSSAIAEGTRDASCQLKSCQLSRNDAETTP